MLQFVIVSFFISMEILPAIDVIEGRCVRLFKGDYNLKKEYPIDPLEVAKGFEQAGLKNLHLIDLEGAKQGRVMNWQVIEKIAKNTHLFIEMGGGIRNKDEISRLFSLGVERVIIGSAVIGNAGLLKEFLQEFGPDKIMVDVGYKQGVIYYKGWQEKSNENFEDFLKKLIGYGVKFILLTDIEKDGVMEGPNFSLYKETLQKFPELLIVASGGISTREDLQKLSQIGVCPVRNGVSNGVWGAVVGKAIYEGKISLDDLKLC